MALNLAAIAQQRAEREAIADNLERAQAPAHGYPAARAARLALALLVLDACVDAGFSRPPDGREFARDSAGAWFSVGLVARRARAVWLVAGW